MPACDCCRSPNAQFPPVKAPDGLPVAVRVCGICARHQGSHPRDLRRREEEHFQQWQFDLELAVEQERRIGQRREKVICDLEDEILRLKDEMAARPVQVVDRNLDQEMVDEALRSRDGAYAARDAAWTVVAQFRGLHHDTGRGVCRCGKSARTCPDTAVIDGSNSFRHWESRQLEQLRRARYSKLPPEHPARTNPRWSQPTA